MRAFYKLVIDENISFSTDAFSKFGEVILLQGRNIIFDKVFNADALVVRSITKVDKSLLNNTKVKFVGTATIGYDHVDVDYLQKNQIGFTSAKGCNADAVAEYVMTTIIRFASENNITLADSTIGIVGVGNIGSRVNKLCTALGMKVKLNDPPLKKAGSTLPLLDLDELYDCDFITLHTPLTTKGPDKTHYLFNSTNLPKLKKGTLFINACRGEVTENLALLSEIEKGNLTAVLDVWENEPDLMKPVLERVLYATPHVAGYTLEGKVNGTKIVYDAFCRHFDEEITWAPELELPEESIITVTGFESIENTLNYIFKKIYDIAEDSKNLFKLLTDTSLNSAEYFDKLRKDYPLRREFSNYTIVIENENKRLEEILKAFRFKIG